MALAKVEIAFGINPFDSTSLDVGGNWVDVSADVREVSYQTSTRSSRFGVFSAGSAQIVLDDRDREYDPSYASSTYVGEFLRSTPVRITGVHSSTDYVQWYGYAKTWTPDYKSKDATTTLTAVDGLGLLARYDLDELASASHDNDSVGARIGRVLDEVGFPSAYRDLDTGTTLTATTFGVNALQHCQLAAMSDGGVLYADRDGTITFDGVDALTTTRQTTSQVTFSHDTAPKYLLDSLRRSGVGEGFRNIVRIGGPAVDTVENDDTTANEAPIVFQRLDLLMDNQAKADGLAAFYGDLYSTEDPHSHQITVTAAAVSDTTYQSQVFPRQLRDRVTVEFDPPGAGADISDQCFIDGIDGKITPSRWDITYTLSSADAYDDNLLAAPSTWGTWDSSVWDGADVWAY